MTSTALRELIAKAGNAGLSGPFRAYKNQDNDGAFLTDGDGATLAVFIPCGDEAVSAFANAELIAAMLNSLTV